MIKELLKQCENRCRELDITLIKSFYEDNDKAVLQALKQYQNGDGGFGHALEPDIQCPDSSVVATDTAVNILLHLKPSKAVDDMLTQIIHYYETVYDPVKEIFPFVPKEVDNYPRAIWWNYDTIHEFPYGNPNLEIIGFLALYRTMVKHLDVNYLVQKALDYLQKENFEKISMHTVLSALRFYERIDKSHQEEIYNVLDTLVNRTVEWDSEKWDDYVLEPYKVRAITKDFMTDKYEKVKKNIEHHEALLKKRLPTPKWSWYQYDDVFKTVRQDWIGLLTYEILCAKEQLK
ncbi:MAG: hypothetical protein K9L26_03215 [Candidatus Izimaplasma sp.]|nr:hypothetical protein [Candidatus Izimaplasma bacterium]